MLVCSKLCEDEATANSKREYSMIDLDFGRPGINSTEIRPRNHYSSSSTMENSSRSNIGNDDTLDNSKQSVHDSAPAREDIDISRDLSANNGSAADRGMSNLPSMATTASNNNNNVAASELDSLKEARTLIHKHREKMIKLLNKKDDECTSFGIEKEKEQHPCCEYCGCNGHGCKTGGTEEKTINEYNHEENSHVNLSTGLDDKEGHQQSTSNYENESKVANSKAAESWNKLRVAVVNSNAESMNDLHSEMDIMRQLVHECCVENEALLEEGGMLVDENEALANELEELKKKLAAEEEKNKSLEDKVEELEISLEEAHAIAYTESCNDESHREAEVLNGITTYRRRLSTANSEIDDTSGEPEQSGPPCSLKKSVVGKASKTMSAVVTPFHRKNSQESILSNGSIIDPKRRRHSAARALEVKDWNKDDFKVAYEIAQRDLAKKHKELDRERRHSLAVFKKQQSAVEALEDVTYIAVEEKKAIAEQKKKCEKIIKSCPTCKPAYTLMLQQQLLEEQERKNILLMKQVQETAIAKEKAEQAAKQRQQQQLMQSSTAAAALRHQNSRFNTSSDSGGMSNSGHGSSSKLRNLNLLGGGSQHGNAAKSNDLASSICSLQIRARGSGMSAATLLHSGAPSDEPSSTSGADPLANGALRMRAKRMSIMLPKDLCASEDGRGGGDNCDKNGDDEPGGARSTKRSSGPRNGLSSNVLKLLSEAVDDDEDEDDADDPNDPDDPEKVDQKEKKNQNEKITAGPRNGLSLDIIKQLEGAEEESDDDEQEEKEADAENKIYDKEDSAPRQSKGPPPQSSGRDAVFSTSWVADDHAQAPVSPLPHDDSSEGENGVVRDNDNQDSASSSPGGDQRHVEEDHPMDESNFDDEPSVAATEDEDGASVYSCATARRKRRGMLPDHPLLLGGLRHRLAPKNNPITLLDLLNKDREISANKKDDESSSEVSDMSSTCQSAFSREGRNPLQRVGIGRRRKQEEANEKGAAAEDSPRENDQKPSTSVILNDKPRRGGTMGNLLRSAQRNQKVQPK